MGTVTGKRQRNGLLDFVKLVAIALVITNHIEWTSVNRHSFLFPFLIDMAVPVFLIISAYLRAKKTDNIGVWKNYTPQNLLTSFLGIFIPYVIAAVSEIIIAERKYRLYDIFPAYRGSFSSALKWFATGLSGPGSYYILILLQLIILFPLIYLLFKKNKNSGLALCAVINVLYDAGVYCFDVDPGIYKFLIFRYILVIGFGIYLAKTDFSRKDDITAAVMFTLGALYVAVNMYIYPFPLFQSWKSSSMLAAPYAYGIMYFLMKYLRNIKYRKIYVFGKATLHIYFVQMAYFAFNYQNFIRNKFGIHQSTRWNLINTVLSVIFCFAAGLLFYMIETRIRKLLFRGLRLEPKDKSDSTPHLAMKQ